MQLLKRVKERAQSDQIYSTNLTITNAKLAKKIELPMMIPDRLCIRWTRLTFEYPASGGQAERAGSTVDTGAKQADCPGCPQALLHC